MIWFWCVYSKRNNHVNIFLKVTMKKGIIHIQLVNETSYWLRWWKWQALQLVVYPLVNMCLSSPTLQFGCNLWLLVWSWTSPLSHMHGTWFWISICILLLWHLVENSQFYYKSYEFSLYSLSPTLKLVSFNKWFWFSYSIKRHKKMIV